MIPKIIHYCWFGGGAIPEEYEEYIAGWETMHPGWEIKQWNEQNSPMDLPYIINALENSKWANVSNLVRFYALYNYGGIYLDTDIKVIKSLDTFLSESCFLGFETEKDGDGNFWVNNAVCGATKKHAFVKYCFKAIQEQYDGTEAANLSAPVIVTKILKEKWGLKEYGYQKLGDLQLFPLEFFYPIKGFESYKTKKVTAETNIDSNTYTIHAWGRSWYSREMFIKDIESLQEYSTDLNTLVNSYKIDVERLTTENRALIESNEKKDKFIEEIKQDIIEQEGDHKNFQSLQSELVSLKQIIQEQKQTFENEYTSLKSEIALQNILVKSVLEILNQTNEQLVRERQAAKQHLQILQEMLKVQTDSYKEGFQEILINQKDYKNELKSLRDNIEEQNDLINSSKEDQTQKDELLQRVIIESANNNKLAEKLMADIKYYQDLVNYYQKNFENQSLWKLMRKKI